MTATCETCRCLPDTVDWPELAKSLRIRLAADQMTAAQLAEQLGLSKSTICRLTKHNKAVTVEAFLKIWTFLHQTKEQ